MVIIIIYWMAGKDLGGFVLMGELQKPELCNGRVEGKAFAFKTLLRFLHIRFNFCCRRNGGKPEEIFTTAATNRGPWVRFTLWGAGGGRERPTEGCTSPSALCLIPVPDWEGVADPRLDCGK